MRIKDRYKLNKEAKVGETCICPSCNTTFIKSNYQQVFCKSKSGTKCKDKYWNTVTPEKRCNTTRISPANANWMAKNDTPIVLGFGTSQRELDRIDREQNELNADGCWESHQCHVERCEFCGCINCRCDDYEMY